MPNEQTPAPMSKEEILKKHGIYPGFRSTYTYEAILSAMDEYRLAFEKEQHQPSDPYWSDPATWPEWANWRAVGEDGCVYFSSILIEANTLYGSWSTSIYAISVECVLERLAAGNSVDALLDEWPHLTRDDLRAALDYAANAVRGERELPLAPKAA